MTPQEFIVRVNAAEPGHVIEYHTGMLYVDREKSPELDELAEKVADYANAGRVLLTQKRFKVDTFTYLATVAEDTDGNYWTKPTDEWAGLA